MLEKLNRPNISPCAKSLSFVSPGTITPTPSKTKGITNDKITEYTFKVNDVLKKFFDEAGIDLIDFKIEFGRYHGDIILADEISPDTCRLWDKETHEKLDKDRFRRDMGNVEDAYQEVFKRIGIK